MAVKFVLLFLLLNVPCQQLWSLRDGNEIVLVINFKMPTIVGILEFMTITNGWHVGISYVNECHCIWFCARQLAYYEISSGFRPDFL